MRFVTKCLLLALLLGAGRQGAAETGDSLLIGGAFALSGSAAPFGTAELNGALLALDHINSSGGIKGRPLRMRVEDTCSTQTGTLTAVNKLLEAEKLRYLVGPTWLDSFQGAVAAAARSGALMISPSAAAANLRHIQRNPLLVFSTYFDAERQMHALMAHLAKQGKKRVALIMDEDPYSQLLRRTARQGAAKHAIEVVFDQSFVTATNDFRAALTRLSRVPADALLYGFVDQGAFLAFLQQRHVLLRELPLYGPHDTEGYLSRPEFMGLWSKVWYTLPQRLPEAFLHAYRRRFHQEAVLTAGNAYDAVMVLSKALQTDNTDPKAAGACLQGREFASVAFGKFGFDQQGGVNCGEFAIAPASAEGR
jgi:branched-chain amino acid transport system substrate-binding protein